MSNIFGEFRNSSSSIWMSTTDLMSGLMIVFMFIAISYMAFTERKAEKTYEIAKEWDRTKSKLIESLHKNFDNDLKKWNAVIVDETISIRWLPRVLFEAGKSTIKPEFKMILIDFCPRYINLLYDFKSIITEVRIEGHTSKEWGSNTPEMEAYLKNMELSQDRTRSVLQFCLGTLRKHIDWTRSKITANGLSSSQVLYTNGKYDKKRSRRVEFRVRTDAEERIGRILQNRKK